MREKLSDYQEMYGDLYNLEATPAESTCYRLAKHDKKKFPDIITASQGNEPFYTNSSHLPVGYTEDIFAALDIEDRFQTLYTSGTVFHTFLGEKLPSWQSAMALVRKIAENYKLPYYTMSPTYSVCAEHGYIDGEVTKCPKCGKDTEIYSRITGYYRPLKNWNAGKSQEFIQRKEYVPGSFTAPKAGVKSEEECCCHDTCETKQVGEAEIILFGTKTCPNCAMAKTFLEKKSLKYTFIDAEENPEEAKKRGVVKAPTMFVTTGDKTVSFNNVSDIRKYIDTNL